MDDTSSMCIEEKERTPLPHTVRKPLWKGNLNVYWIIGTGIGLWFLFIYTPMHHETLLFDFFFIMHLISASVVYLICMWNTFHTPSHGDMYRKVHILLGRTALVLGVLEFTFGPECNLF